ncbi:MAG TPA: Gfo/Idh/MocA family oxidoreductase [Geminicoccus sp.]|jgi:predicted dehydrogenase|uniref:Gfo/Idh/MocA family protein n=1 Tax=Geminicoccus sp. TaxID=2024832 RepID=UPI002E3631AD|nr:Gfo/Idh/MocA family oxidoreductase [Geminicoccus sp.]HEX2528914.1 Gfo/Idh/MocA family oxidoreductase [Geminicoccus sp.]
MTFRDDLCLGRRSLIAVGGLGLVGTALSGTAHAQLPGPTPVDIGKVENGKVTFPNWRGQSDRPSPPPPAPLPPEERVGFAIVGLGRLSLEELLPAFAECKRARPVPLVSGTPDKAAAVAAQYGIDPDAIYDYDSFDRIKDNPDVQVVYVVVPNGLHRDFTLRAANAGKHVLTEKPMANNSAEARDMIEGCRRARVKLMVAYRCQYEPNNRAAIEMVRGGELGGLRFIEATNTQTMGPGNQWRFRKALTGGGALPDIGIYCLNAARYLTGEEPVEVQGRIFTPPGDERYAEVEETVSFTLRFPSGVIANCATSYGAHENKDLRVHGEKGSIDLQRAFAYEGQRLQLARRAGEAEGIEERRLGQKNQFALEIDHMAQCVLEDRMPHTPGEEGLQDHLLMEAIYRSAGENVPVRLEPVQGLDTTRGPAPAQES